MLCAWSSDLRSSDLSSCAAPRCLFCAWFSDLTIKCLFSIFLSTYLDDFEALGANFSALGAILEPLGGAGGPLYRSLKDPISPYVAI